MNRRPIVLVPEAPELAAAVPHLRIVPLAALPQCEEAVVFIDCLLDEGSGFELCRRLRANPATAGSRIVIVLEDDDRELRRRALRAGADDYLVGPLTPALLSARVGREAQPEPDGAADLSAIELDQDAFQLRAAGKLVAIPPNEFKLLAYFLENSNRLLTRAELIRALKSAESAVDERTVDVWIGRVRRAFRAAGAQPPIRTVRSLGYVYDSPAGNHEPKRLSRAWVAARTDAEI